MDYKIQNIDKSQVELTITVTPDDYKKHMINSAGKISERVAIKGFRKGKAPYDLVKKEMGEMKIMEEALEKIIQESFFEAITKEKIETIGMPEINVEKSAPGNDVIYKAKVALLPKVKLADLSTIKIKRSVKEVGEKEVDEVLENLTKMQAKEVVKEGEATKENKIVIDMDLFLDGVPIDGGQAKDYGVYLSETQHVPGFNDELIGLKKDDKKEFEITFPKDYYNKQLAGNKGVFKVVVKDVFTRDFPEVDEAFAKTLGQESVAKLREILQQNLTHEAEHKADQTSEIEIFDTLIEKSEFDEIPEVLINAERQKMFYELKQDLEKNGVSIEQYLADIKKKEDELFEDFKERATKRAKASLLSRRVAEENKMEISDSELESEMVVMEETYKDMPEYKENIKKPEVRDSIRNMLLNRKVVAFLKDTVLEGGAHKCDDHKDEKE